VIDVWTTSHPTLQGKELILKALITSRSWFLASSKINEARLYRLKSEKKEDWGCPTSKQE